MATGPLYKTTIVIWSEYDPFGGDADILMADDGLELLVRDSRDGESYCSKAKGEKVEDPTKDPDWDGTEFFDDGN